jgi:S-phase kinase-associated protein 1
LILAANYLDIKSLLELGCKHLANEIKSKKTVQELRDRFGIENDYTPEEIEQVKKEMAWASSDNTTASANF